jgi:Mor family transcriptional regulator
MYFLYEKTHKQTGLKYLGQTKENPYLYTGSGIDWRKHLKEYGSDIDTYVLFQSEIWNEIVYWGRYYSQLYNIVNAQDDFGNKIWANRIPETGGGGSDWNEETKLKHKMSLKASHNTVEAKKLKIKIMSDPNVKQKHKDSLKQSLNTLEAKSRRSISRSKPEAKEKHRAAVTAAMNKQEYLDKVSGKNHHRYDHTMYEFHHDSGIMEICTRKELISKYNLNDSHIFSVVNKIRKHHKGWRVR